MITNNRDNYNNMFLYKYAQIFKIYQGLSYRVKIFVNGLYMNVKLSSKLIRKEVVPGLFDVVVLKILFNNLHSGTIVKVLNAHKKKEFLQNNKHENS